MGKFRVEIVLDEATDLYYAELYPGVGRMEPSGRTKPLWPTIEAAEQGVVALFSKGNEALSVSRSGNKQRRPTGALISELVAAAPSQDYQSTQPQHLSNGAWIATVVTPKGHRSVVAATKEEGLEVLEAKIEREIISLRKKGR